MPHIRTPSPCMHNKMITSRYCIWVYSCLCLVQNLSFWKFSTPNDLLAIRHGHRHRASEHGCMWEVSKLFVFTILLLSFFAVWKSVFGFLIKNSIARDDFVFNLLYCRKHWIWELYIAFCYFFFFFFDWKMLLGDIFPIAVFRVR